MGIILSRFRKKKSTLEVLETLEKEIKSIEEYGHTTERQHKAVVGRLVLFSVGLYVLTAFLFYFFFFPASLYDQLLYVIPLLLFPLIIVFVKRLVSWWYRRKLSQNQEKLADIRKHKKDLLEEVMDKETYKIARQILEKFAPDQLRKTTVSPSTAALILRNTSDATKQSNQFSTALSQRNSVGTPLTGSTGTELRRRPVESQLDVSTMDRLTPHQIGSSLNSTRISPVGVIASRTKLTSESTSVITNFGVTSPVASDCTGTTVGTAFIPDDISRATGTVAATAAAVAAAVAAATTTSTITTNTTTTAATVITGTTSTNCIVTNPSIAAATAGDVSSGTAMPLENGNEEEADTDDDNEAGICGSPTVEVNGDKGEIYSKKRIQKESGSPLAQPVHLVRPILPRERTVMDRLVEYLVGDGLNQRYALICRNCSSHNGMALKEEFEYLAFRCCYCYHWNPARKQRLHAPRFDALPSSGNTTSSSPADSNTEDDNGGDDDDHDGVDDDHDGVDDDISGSKNEATSNFKLSVQQQDAKEEKSEQCDNKVSTNSIDGFVVPVASASAESPSSTEKEFETLVPDNPLLTQGGGDVQRH